MKKITIAALLLCAAAAPIAAGPFGIFGRGRWCGPGGCPSAPAPPEVLRVLPAVDENFGKPRLVPLEAWQTHGVEADRINGKDECSWSIGGKKVSRAEAQSKMLEDDSAKLWLVLTGEGRERVEADLRADPKYAELLGRVRVWSKPANHFSLLDRDSGKPMFPIGSPGVYLAQADGVELHKQSGYRGPADLEALRKADPLFKPEPPAPKGPDTKGPGKRHSSTPAVAVVGGAGILLLLARIARRQQPSA